MVIYKLANPESGLSPSLNFRLYLGPPFVNRLKFVQGVGGRPIPEARQFAVSTGMESGADALYNSTGWRGYGRFPKSGLQHRRMIETVLFTTGDAFTCLLPGGRFRTGSPGVSTTRPGRLRSIRPSPVRSPVKETPDSNPITCMRTGKSRQSRIGRSLLPGTVAGSRHKADRGLRQLQ